MVRKSLSVLLVHQAIWLRATPQTDCRFSAKVTESGSTALPLQQLLTVHPPYAGKDRSLLLEPLLQ
jgi:hypothetical protein